MNNDIEITLRGGSVKPEPTYRFRENGDRVEITLRGSVKPEPTYRFRGNGDRKGQECRILKYLSGFDCLVKFNDGEQRVVTRSAILRI